MQCSVRARLVAVAAVAAVAAGGLAACGGKKAPAASAPTTSAAPTPTPAPVPTLLSPLTGLPVAALGPVVAVKIDDVGSYGQNGLDAADVVYAEQVEGGLTRLLALFSATTPTQVGPVRSARESDLEVLGQYGKVALAFSGANAGVLREIRRANVRDDSYDDVTGAYFLDADRPSPYQFLVKVQKLAAQHPGVAAKDVAFRFAPTAPAQSAAAPARAGRVVAVRFPGTTLSASYAGGVYTLSRDGRPLTTDGRPVTATNVLLQTVTVRSTRFVDHNGVRDSVLRHDRARPGVGAPWWDPLRRHLVAHRTDPTDLVGGERWGSTHARARPHLGDPRTHRCCGHDELSERAGRRR